MLKYLVLNWNIVFVEWLCRFFITPGTREVYEKLLDILSSNQLKKDILMLSHGHQTSALEDNHSVVNHFAPKKFWFSYHVMICRYLRPKRELMFKNQWLNLLPVYTFSIYEIFIFSLWLAALHFNENIGRNVAATKDGKARYRIVYPKSKKVGYTVKKISVECTYGIQLLLYFVDFKKDNFNL